MVTKLKIWFVESQMKKKGWKIEHLAKEAELSTRSVWNFLNRKGNPNKDSLLKIANALKVRENDIIDGPTIVGRNNEFATLTECWQDNSVRIISVSGCSRIGKTELVKHWTNAFSDDGINVVWVTCDARPDPYLLFNSLEEKVLPKPLDTPASPRYKAKKVLEEIAKSKRDSIIVLDGFDAFITPTLSCPVTCYFFNELLRIECKKKCLLISTSARPIPADFASRNILVGPLSETDAALLIARRLPELARKTRNDIARKLGCHPNTVLTITELVGDEKSKKARDLTRHKLAINAEALANNYQEDGYLSCLNFADHYLSAEETHLLQVMSCYLSVTVDVQSSHFRVAWLVNSHPDRLLQIARKLCECRIIEHEELTRFRLPSSVRNHFYRRAKLSGLANKVHSKLKESLIAQSKDPTFSDDERMELLIEAVHHESCREIASLDDIWQIVWNDISRRELFYLGTIKRRWETAVQLLRKFFAEDKLFSGLNEKPQIEHRLQDPFAKNMAMEALAYSLMTQGQMDRVTELLFKTAINGFKKSNNHLRASFAAGSLVEFYLYRGQAKKAGLENKKEIGLAKKSGNSRRESGASVHEGLVLMATQELEKAKRVFDAISYDDDLFGKGLVAHAMFRAYGIKDLKVARILCSSPPIKIAGMRGIQGQCDRILGEIELHDGNLDKSHFLLERALEAAEEAYFVPQIIRAEIALGCLDKRRGKNAWAEEHFRRAEDLSGSILFKDQVHSARLGKLPIS